MDAFKEKVNRYLPMIYFVLQVAYLKHCILAKALIYYKESIHKHDCHDQKWLR